jgi:ribosome-binding protein aMBF1 (putative translation factor)
MANILPVDTSPHAVSGRKFVMRSSVSAANVVSISTPQNQQPATRQVLLNRHHPLMNRPEWRDTEYRQSYLEASIEQGIAWQIKANRQMRGISQEKLAERLGTGQSAISRLEDPEYGAHSLDTLIKVAHAFDCALSVRFISYSRLAEESEDLSKEALFAVPFASEKL